MPRSRTASKRIAAALGLRVLVAVWTSVWLSPLVGPLAERLTPQLPISPGLLVPLTMVVALTLRYLTSNRPSWEMPAWLVGVIAAIGIAVHQAAVSAGVKAAMSSAFLVMALWWLGGQMSRVNHRLVRLLFAVGAVVLTLLHLLNARVGLSSDALDSATLFFLLAGILSLAGMSVFESTDLDPGSGRLYPGGRWMGMVAAVLVLILVVGWLVGRSLGLQSLFGAFRPARQFLGRLLGAWSPS